MDFSVMDFTSVQDAKCFSLPSSPQHSGSSTSDLYLDIPEAISDESCTFLNSSESEYDDYGLDRFNYSIYMNKCGRRTMEDRFSVCQIKQNEYFFGVYDGHGSSEVADYLAHNLHNYILENQLDKNIAHIINQSHSKIDQEVLQSASLSGSCSLTVLIKDNRFYISNLGDSRAIMVLKDSSIVELSREHRPSQEDELERIEKNGGIVISVRKALRVQGSLAVSRSIGDRELKKYLSNVPEIREYERKGNEKFLVIATDGLWNEASNDWVGKYVHDKRIEGLSQRMFEHLIETKEYLKDNTTIICVDVERLFVQSNQN